jgi:hypothetical protein
MRASFQLAGLAFVLLLPCTAAAQDATVMKWNLAQGKTYFQKLTTQTVQNMTVQGMNVKQTQTQVYYLRLTCRGQDAAGNTILVQKIEGLKMKIDIGGNPINFDSTQQPQPKSPMTQFFDALVGSEFEFTLDKNLKPVKVSGTADLIKKVGQANPSMKPLLLQMLSDETMKQMINHYFQFLPPDPVKKGDRWNSESTLELGPIGGYKLLNRYSLEGIVSGLCRIDVLPTITYIPPGPNAGGGLPFKVKDAKLTSGPDSKGTILFDHKNGFQRSMSMSVSLQGKLTVEIGGQVTEVDLTQTQSSESVTSMQTLLGQ